MRRFIAPFAVLAAVLSAALAPAWAQRGEQPVADPPARAATRATPATPAVPAAGAAPAVDRRPEPTASARPALPVRPPVEAADRERPPPRDSRPVPDREKPPERPPRTGDPEPLSLECRGTDERTGTEGRPVIACRWTPSHHPQFAQYRLFRRTRDSEPAVVFETPERDRTAYADRAVEPGQPYGYLVKAFDGEGNLVGRSNPARAVAGRADEARPEELRIACQPLEKDGRRAVACKWTPSQAESFAGYRLWRASEPERQRAVVHETSDRDATSHVDASVVPGMTYWYAVQAVDAAGQTIGRSRPVPVTA